MHLPDLVVPENHEIGGKLNPWSEPQPGTLAPELQTKDKKKDVFISYAQLDDVALTREEAGWISMFDQALRNRTAQLLGYQPVIWRDPQVTMDEQAIGEFVKLKVMISILSPRYLESENCLTQLKKFYSIANDKGGVRINNKWRIFKVIKTPVPREMHPPEIEGILGYEFFEISEDGHFREFTLDKRSPNYYQFLERFEDVAQDLSQVIKSLEKDSLQPPKDQDSSKDLKAVYLAKTTSWLEQIR